MKHISERESFSNDPTVYGKSHIGIPLEVWLPLAEDSMNVLVIAGIHGGCEPEGTKLLSCALRCLNKEELKCAVVLSANPDGMLRGTRGNFRGVDLNRNFPTSDWHSGTLTYKWSFEDERKVKIRSGEHPASEPETEALLGLIERLKPKSIISIHAPAACIDDPDNTAIGAWLAERTNLPHLLDWDIETPGSLGTWGKENGLPVITVELPDESIGDIMKANETVLIDLLKGNIPFKNAVN